MAAGTKSKNIVYVVGAGLSAGLGFPTIRDLLPRMWERLEAKNLADDLAKVIRFHHPAFNASLADTFPNIETLLSEMQANEQLFESSRPATGKFKKDKLFKIRESLMQELANWFHELKKNALKTPPAWLGQLTSMMKDENAQVISFNWDLVLDQKLFGKNINRSSYGFDDNRDQVRLIKPHGSLNWYDAKKAKKLKTDKIFDLMDSDDQRIIAFRPYRAPISVRREYMPLIIPPVYAKQFNGSAFRHLWQEAVAVLSTASEVRFLGYSLAPADFHARFILRCGFHNQVEGVLSEDGRSRKNPTGQSQLTIVDPNPDGVVPTRIREAVGWHGTWHKQTIEQWLETMPS